MLVLPSRRSLINSHPASPTPATQKGEKGSRSKDTCNSWHKTCICTSPPQRQAFTRIAPQCLPSAVPDNLKASRAAVSGEARLYTAVPDQNGASPRLRPCAHENDARASALDDQIAGKRTALFEVEAICRGVLGQGLAQPLQLDKVHRGR